VIYASNAADIVCTVAGEINIPGATITMNEDPLIKGGQGLYYVEGVFGFQVNGNELTVCTMGMIRTGIIPIGGLTGIRTGGECIRVMISISGTSTALIRHQELISSMNP